MHPELRLIEDFHDRPRRARRCRRCRACFTSCAARSRSAGARVAAWARRCYSEDTITAHAEDTGATLWRWELSDPRQPPSPNQERRASVRATSCAEPLEHLPEGDLLWRGDSVAFPPGGCAYLHRHQGPGIRCLIEGPLRVDYQRAVAYATGSAMRGSRRARIRCSRRPATAPTRFVRVHDPAAHADRQKLDPVRQRRGQGEAEVAAISRVRRCAADWG